MNLAAVLDEEGVDFSHVVKATVHPHPRKDGRLGAGRNCSRSREPGADDLARRRHAGSAGKSGPWIVPTIAAAFAPGQVDRATPESTRDLATARGWDGCSSEDCRWSPEPTGEALAVPKIADRLVITPKTADHHEQHIFAKIGVSTRGAAALFAVEHGAWSASPRGQPPAKPGSTRQSSAAPPFGRTVTAQALGRATPSSPTAVLDSLVAARACQAPPTWPRNNWVAINDSRDTPSAPDKQLPDPAGRAGNRRHHGERNDEPGSVRCDTGPAPIHQHPRPNIDLVERRQNRSLIDGNWRHAAPSSAAGRVHPANGRTDCRK